MKKVISLVCRFFGWLWDWLRGGRVELGAWMYWTDPETIDEVERQHSEEEYLLRERCTMEYWDLDHVWHESYVGERTREWDEEIRSTSWVERAR